MQRLDHDPHRLVDVVVAELAVSCGLLIAAGYPLARPLLIVLPLAMLVLLGMLVSFTTRASDMIETIERGLAPIALVGIDPAKVSLALSLALRFIPLLYEQVQDIREAQRVRGLERLDQVQSVLVEQRYVHQRHVRRTPLQRGYRFIQRTCLRGDLVTRIAADERDQALAHGAQRRGCARVERRAGGGGANA